MEKARLVVVVPCFNEEPVLAETTEVLLKLMHFWYEKELITAESRILYVDDGSTDRTWEMIAERSEEYAFVSGVKLSRNFGHQGALLAGISVSLPQADCIVSIDADLQDDPEAITQFLVAYYEGYEVVYGVRRKRETDTYFKRTTAQLFYKLMGKVGVDLVPEHADFRLLSKRAASQLLSFHESTVFLRGIVPLLGYKSTKVYYDRSARKAGESKYPLKKMISFSIEGLTSFSIAPIKAILSLGVIALIISIGITCYSITRKYLGYTVSGWTSLMISLWIIGGLQLISISILGVYIGKIFVEVKERPRFIVESETFSDPVKTEK